MEELREFLRAEFENDPRLRSVFTIHFQEKHLRKKAFMIIKKRIFISEILLVVMDLLNTALTLIFLTLRIWHNDIDENISLTK